MVDTAKESSDYLSIAREERVRMKKKRENVFRQVFTQTNFFFFSFFFREETRRDARFVSAMIFLIFIFLTSIEQIRADCSFLSTIYHRQSAVENQFRLINESSIQLSASFSFLSSKSFSHFELGLIYQYPSTDFFVPFPVDFNCSTNVDSCQIKSMTNTHLSNNNAESIRVTLTSINYRTARTNYFWQKTGLFLRQGRYQLSNCTEKNGRSITDPRTIFFIEIQYEKPIGESSFETRRRKILEDNRRFETFLFTASQCNPNSNDCGPSSLIDCSSYSSTCQCVSTKNQFASIRIENSSFCADSLNESNCQIFPSRCVDWCNGSENVFCVCPSETRKIQREKKFFCELIDDRNLSCSIDDPIRLCSSSRCCVESRCVDCSNNQQNSTIKLLTISR